VTATPTATGPDGGDQGELAPYGLPRSRTRMDTDVRHAQIL
jgi:hypothetical protein